MEIRNYNCLNEIRLKLLDKGIIEILPAIDEEQFYFIRESIKRLEAVGCPDIEVHITSNGGSVITGLMIFDFIRCYPGKKTGKVIGFARSMGAVILQACDRRLCLAQSKVLIHHINKGDISLDELKDIGKLEKIIEDMDKDQEKLYKILEERTKKSRNEIVEACKKDLDMSAEEALEFGLIDEII